MSEYAVPTPRFSEDADGRITPHVCATVMRADPDVARKVMDSPVGIDGRSEFVWVRLASGDLMLGVFPRGDTYFDTEADPYRI